MGVRAYRCSLCKKLGHNRLSCPIFPVTNTVAFGNVPATPHKPCLPHPSVNTVTEKFSAPPPPGADAETLHLWWRLAGDYPQMPSQPNSDDGYENLEKIVSLEDEAADKCVTFLRSLPETFVTATPADVWENFFAQLPESVVYRVCAKRNLPNFHQNFFAHHNNWAIRASVAESENLPDNLAIMLARDPEQDVRMSIANNTWICEKALEITSTDFSAHVRYATASNCFTPMRTLLQMKENDPLDYIKTAAHSTWIGE